MQPMHRLWIAAVCLAAYGTGQAQTGTPSAQTRAAERAAIADKRAAITQAQMAGEQACRQRFAVEDCLKDVRDQARAELAPLRARELELNQQERQERAAARLQAIEAKQAQTVPPAPLQAHTRKPAPDAAALEQTQGARAAAAAARPPSSATARPIMPSGCKRSKPKPPSASSRLSTTGWKNSARPKSGKSACKRSKTANAASLCPCPRQALLPPKDKVHRAQQAQAGPQVIELERLFHVEHGKRYKHRQGQHFLQNFELAQVQLLVANAVGRHLQQVFKQRNAPTDQGGNKPGLGTEFAQVGIPGKGHKNVAQQQQKNRPINRAHSRQKSKGCAS